MTAGNNQGSTTPAQQPNPSVMNSVQDDTQNQQQDMSTDQSQEEKKRANAKTEAEARSIDGKAGQSGKSSHDHMGHVEAGSHDGAGGGAKAGRNH